MESIGGGSSNNCSGAFLIGAWMAGSSSMRNVDLAYCDAVQVLLHALGPSITAAPIVRRRRELSVGNAGEVGNHPPNLQIA